ncbi:hypothetical protein UlMin_039886 [Ulmus minor]
MIFLLLINISFVIIYLELVPGCVVMESGTGSGSLITSFARAVAPMEYVYTFDFHEQREASASALGLSIWLFVVGLITVFEAFWQIIIQIL